MEVYFAPFIDTQNCMIAGKLFLFTILLHNMYVVCRFINIIIFIQHL